MGEGKAVAGQTREHRSVEVRDERDMPTITVRRADLDVIAATFDGRAVPTARSIYVALIEVGAGEVTRRQLADTAGITPKALGDYAPQFEACGLVAIERDRVDARGRSLPNVWRLTNPAMGGTGGDASTPGDPPSSSSGSASSGEDKDVGAPAVTLPADVEADVVALLKAKRRVDARLVSEEEMRKAAAALVAFNAAQGADHGLGANLSKIVGRIRERPAWTADKWVRLVESAWRLRWWEKTGSGRRPTPAVVFGNAGVCEQVAMDAAQEARGEAVADTPERRGRFTRTVEPE